MTTIKPAIVAAAILALAACDANRARYGNTMSPGVSPANTPGTTAATGVPAVGSAVRTPTSPTPGDPTAPTAGRPQGASTAPATGGGTPIPTRPGGAGGVGGGVQPGFGGSSGR